MKLRARAAVTRRKLGLAVAVATSLAFLIWFVANFFAFHDRWDPQGGSNFWCLNTILPSIPNGAGWTITAHRTDCDTLAKDSATYVYLHRADQSDRSYSLILRYDGGDPEVRWADPSHVSIAARHVSDVDKQVIRLWDFTIAYELQMDASTAPP